MLSLLNKFYCGLLFYFTIGIIKHKKAKKKTILQPLSVISAARNEEKNIANLLRCLCNQDYPQEKFEIIIADDRSTDKTAEIVEEWQKKYPFVKVIRISAETKLLVGKKNALEQAINLAKNDILVFTDADCLPPKYWLQEINNHFSEETDFVAGYAPLILKPKWLEILKNLERASIFSITAGSFGWNWGITCVARNMAYRKSLFNEINGFEGIGHLRSGDDDLMLQKMTPHIRNMRFMFTEKSFVPSEDNKTITEQVNLETRRASKWKYYPISIKVITFLVFIYYCLLGKFTIETFFKNKKRKLLSVLILKLFSEFILLTTFLVKIRRKKLLLAFPLAELLYLPYYLFFALKGTFGKYSWKN